MREGPDRADGGGRRLVGVTGHRGRPLPEADPTLLEQQVDGVLSGLAELGMQDLVSPLAEGADRIVAHRALGAGWSLQALLPFEGPRYERDFRSAASTREFRQLTARASAVEVVSGSAGEGGAGPPESGPAPPPGAGATSGSQSLGAPTVTGTTPGLPAADRRPGDHADDPDLPYRRVGQALLDRVVVLVAVWDGHPPRGPGGTGEVVQEAVRRGIPVVWIGSRTPHVVRLMEPGVPGARVVGTTPAGGLPALLGRWLSRATP